MSTADRSASGVGKPAGTAGVEGTGGGQRGGSRSLRILLGVAAIVVVSAGLRTAAGLVGPILLAALLTIAVAPISRRLRRTGFPSWASTLVTVIAVYAVVATIAFGLTISTIKLVGILPTYADKVSDLRASIAATAESFGLPSKPSGQVLSEVDLGNVVATLGGILAEGLSLLSNLFFLVTLLFFAAAETAISGGRAEALRQIRPSLTDALAGFVEATQRYLLVSTVFGAIVAVFDGVALWILGVPLPVLWALLAFLTNYIPNIGFVIGLIPPALLGLLSGGVSTMIWVIIVYCVLNVVIQTVLQPRFVGDAVKLSPLVTFLSLVFWAYVLGAVGALLAVPMTLFVRAVLVDTSSESRWWRLLIGPMTIPQRGMPEDAGERDQSIDAAGN